MILKQTSSHFLPTSPTTLSVHNYHFFPDSPSCACSYLSSLFRELSCKKRFRVIFSAFHLLFSFFSVLGSLGGIRVLFHCYLAIFMVLRRHGYAFPPRIRSSLSALFDFCFSWMSIILLVTVFMRCHTFHRLSPCSGLGVLEEILLALEVSLAWIENGK